MTVQPLVAGRIQNNEMIVRVAFRRPAAFDRLLSGADPAVLALSEPRLMWIDALIDTGATLTIVDEHIARGLPHQGAVTFRNASGPGDRSPEVHTSRHGAELVFDVPSLHSVTLQVAAKNADLVLRSQALIGMDLLAKFRLVVDGPARRFELWRP